MMARALALALVTAAGALACGAKSHEPKTHQVEIRMMKFSPADLEVAVGDTIVWTNADIVPHTVTSANPSAAAFDSHMLTSKQTWRYEVTKAGVFPYACTYHPTMRAQFVAR